MGRNAYMKQWRAKNKGKYRKQEQDYAATHVEESRRRRRRYHLKHTYGMHLEEFEEMFVAQDGVCAVCGNPEFQIRRGQVKSLDVDHDHDTGDVRGLLCSPCNAALGLLQEDPARIQSLLTYIESWQ